jgi:hypothetical protein
MLLNAKPRCALNPAAGGVPAGDGVEAAPGGVWAAGGGSGFPGHADPDRAPGGAARPLQV